jgi:hypothetical protein
LPKETEFQALFLILIKKGFCTYKELADGTYSMKEVFEMQDLLLLDNYIETMNQQYLENMK